MGMSRVLRILGLIALLGGLSQAQVHGVPPLAQSYTGGVARGIPPSVTSLGPNGYNSPRGVAGFRGGHRGTGMHHRGSRGFGNGYGGYGYFGYPYYYGGYYGYYPYYSEPDTMQPAPAVQPETEPPARTIYERRSTLAEEPQQTDRYGEHYLDSREQQRTAPAPQPPAAEQRPEKPAMPVILVFRDGHKQEVTNYAIVGDTLYDVGGSGAKKIKLADLNLDETQKVNDDRGVDFALPSTLKPQG